MRWAAEGAEDSWAEEAELLDDCPSLVAEALGGEVYRLQVTRRRGSLSSPSIGRPLPLCPSPQEESKRLQEETARLSSRLKRRREEEEAAAAEVEVLRGAAAEAKEEAERLREELLTERRRRADLVVLSKNLFLGLAKP